MSTSGRSEPIRILLVDDQPLFRAAIAALVNAQPDMTVVGEAENGLQGVELTAELQPDVVVMDVEMPVMNGVEAVRHITEQLIDTRILMLTVSENDGHIRQALQLGARGYLLKDLRPDQLYDMIRSAMRDETPLSPAVASHLVDDLRSVKGGLDEPKGPALSRREIEILRLVAEGMSNKQIGRRLTITEGTVKNHIHNALEKLGMDNRVQAAAYVVRQGWGRPGG